MEGFRRRRARRTIANGTNGDAFLYDATQWSDSDGDGYGDNPNGNLPDAYPNDSTQRADSDGDGYGDNYAYSINATTGLRNQTGDAFPWTARNGQIWTVMATATT